MLINRREEIIEAFIKVAMRKGINKTTMQDVAKTVGIGASAIYLDFANKEELIDTLGKRTFQKFELLEEQVLNQVASPEKKLHDLLVGDVEFYSKHIRQNRSLFEFFHNEYIKYIKKNLRKHRLQFERQKMKRIKQVLEEGVQEGNFIIDNVAEVARVLSVIYDSRYFRDSFILKRKHEEVVKDAEVIFVFLLKSIKRP